MVTASAHWWLNKSRFQSSKTHTRRFSASGERSSFCFIDVSTMSVYCVYCLSRLLRGIPTEVSPICLRDFSSLRPQVHNNSPAESVFCCFPTKMRENGDNARTGLWSLSSLITLSRMSPAYILTDLRIATFTSGSTMISW